MVTDRGLGKIQLAVAGSEAVCLYGFFWGAMSCTPMSSIPPPPRKHHQSPTATISALPPQEHKEAAPEASAPAVKELELALEVPSPAAPGAQEVVMPTHMITLCLQLGASRGFTSTQVEGCSKGLSTSHVTICAQRSFRGEAGMSLL